MEKLTLNNVMTFTRDITSEKTRIIKNIDDSPETYIFMERMEKFYIALEDSRKKKLNRRNTI
jgi:hypothetical protein